MTLEDPESLTGARPIHVERLGSGPPMILLHSAGLSSRQWRRLVPGLVARGYRTVAPDLSGHGQSVAWEEPEPFSITRDVEALLALLEAEGPSHIIGHSYGALVGLRAALAAPRLVRTMVLFEPVAFGALEPLRDGDARIELTNLDLRWGTTASERERWLRTFVDYWGGDGAWAALRDEAREEFRRVAWVVREGVRTLFEIPTRASEYRGIRRPVQFLTGEKSPLAARRVVQRLAEALPGASIATIPGAGHMAPLTHADLVNGVIIDAIDSLAARAPAHASE